jgi:hypothetical protein
MDETSLQGRLSDFTLEEILQLMALQQKTGLLRVDASYPMALYFEQGMLVSYRDRRGAGKDPLESFLKRYGFFPHESWEHVDFVQRNSQLDLTEILVNESLLTAEELAWAQHEAAQEHIYCGMQLRDGRYHFASGRSSLMGLKGRVRMKVDGLLMEAVRRIDEMPGLQERYHADGIKLIRTDLEVDLAQESATIRRVLAICGRECTLGQVVSQARMSEFDTLSTLEQLREAGVLEVLDPTTLVKTKEAEERAKARNELRPRRAPAVGLAVASLLVALTSLVLQPLAGYRDADTDGALRARELRLDRDLARLHAALELYEIAHQRFPDELQRLEAAGFADEEILQRWQADLDYTVGANAREYTLRRR